MPKTLMRLSRRTLMAGLGGVLGAPAIVRAQTVLPHRYPALWLPARAPLGPVALIPGHALSHGLIAAYVPACAYGLADITGNTIPLVLNAGGALLGDGGNYGEAIQGDSATTPSGAQTAAQPVNLCLTTALTVGCVGHNSGVHPTTQFPIVGLSKTTGSSYLATICTHANGGPLVIISGNGGSPVVNTSTVSPPQPGSFSAVASFPFGGGTGECAANGISGGTYVVSGTPTYDATTRFCVGTQVFATTQIANYNTAGAFVWNRALSHDELLLFSREPFSMLEPISLDDRRFTAAALGGSNMMLRGIGQ